MRNTLLVLLLLISTQVFSAPFCVVNSYGTNCWYYDMNSCRQAAGNQGACIVNQQEVQQPASSGTPFCVVTGYATNCWYYDAQSCRQAASSSGGACVVNPNR
jgi:outer membrane protein assembly factor BamE (lipoprotein component of BamABCDE complex)